MNANNEIFINIYYLLSLKYTRYYNNIIIIIIYYKIIIQMRNSCKLFSLHNIIFFSNTKGDTLNKKNLFD